MERFLQKKKNGIYRGLALNFGGFLKNAFWHF
ncbi:hypothetical protein HPGAM_04695 [Helicobacter pylori Gambia94/24]|nr:hypothetical protein HPGAM_04695 [Helicobacter pylori Gambia94/24]